MLATQTAPRPRKRTARSKPDPKSQVTRAYQSTQLGYFLDFPLWQDAISLLSFQVAQKATNRHYHTLSMTYYERLGSPSSQLSTPQYYEAYIASSLFYGLSRTFAAEQYTVPKSSFRLRRYFSFTYPMRALYYAVCLYLVKLSQDFIQNFLYPKKANVQAFYGGKLRYENDRLGLSTKSVYYLHHYKSFRKTARAKLSEYSDDCVAIRMDIENYYDSISVDVLLRKLDAKVKPRIKKDLKFDEATQEQISSFFRFIMGGTLGVPQSENDITSGFIGYLYLTFADLLIEDIIKRPNLAISNHFLVRYVDDTYIFLRFDSGLSRKDQEYSARSLMSQIADSLFDDLGLKLNTKTRIFWLDDEQDRGDLEKSLKKVSSAYEDPDDETAATPRDRAEAILDVINELKSSPMSEYFELQSEMREEILKDVFSRPVNQILESNEMRSRIASVFRDFDFELTKVQPREILVLLAKDPATEQRFRQFLLNKSTWSTADVDLAIRYLCQTGFTDTGVLHKVGTSSRMRQVLKIFGEATFTYKYPGYFDLPLLKVKPLGRHPNIVEQIRCRVLSERAGAHSLALNHLVNEFQAICRWLSGNPPGDFSAKEVDKFLESRGIANELRLQITHLFDRRNANTISHPGSADSLVWGVTQSEYSHYREVVAQCLLKLLP